MPTLTLDGRSLHHLDQGTGDPVVLVHSSGMSARQWNRLVALLSARHRVLVPDLPGSGESAPVPHDAPWTNAQDLAALAAVIARSDAPVHLVGHSYGGLLALMFAREHPERVRTLSVYEPVAFGVLHATHDDAGLADLANADTDGTFFDDRTGGSEPWLERFIDYWNGPGAWRAMPAPARDGFLRTGRKVFQEVRALMHDRTPHTAYGVITAKTLLLRGERSPLAARSVCEVLASSIPGASLVTIEGAGHMGPLTHAAAVNAAIDRHLTDAVR